MNDFLRGFFSMKGIILAAGNGTRLRPLTNVISKILLPVYDKPMIYYGLEKLRRAGIMDICIVISPQHEEQFRKQLADEAGITFVVQEEAKGTAHALGLTKDFADGDDIAVLYGDNLFDQELDVSDFKGGCRLHLHEVEHPERFGVATVKDGKVVHLEEKPENPQSSLAIIGMYVYDASIYERIGSVGLSSRGEYEITAVFDSYIEEGRMDARIVSGFWSDAGTFASLLAANEWARKA
jgi:glucose-1-phosphate thymidylyltransferase